MKLLERQLRELKSVRPSEHWRSATRDFLLLRASNTPARSAGIFAYFNLLFGFIRKSPISNLQSLISNFQFLLSRRLVVVPLSVFLIVVVGVGVTANVAKSSLPGDVLYPIKLVSERVQISLTWQGKDRSKLKAEFATRRLDEISTLIKKPNVQKEHVEQAMTDFKDKVASAKQDLVDVKGEGNVHDVVEVAKILDTQTQEYEKKLGEVKNELSPETKQELTVTMNAALDAVEEVSVSSLSTLVEQADKDGVTKEEVRQIIQNRIDTVATSTNKEVHTSEPLVSEVELQKVGKLPPTSLPPTTSIDDKILEVRSYLAEDDLTKALGAVTETKALVRSAEKQKNDREVDTSRGSSTSESSNKTNPNILAPNDLEPKIADHTIVDKKQEVDPSVHAPARRNADALGGEVQPPQVEKKTESLSPQPAEAPGAIIIEEK